MRIMNLGRTAISAFGFLITLSALAQPANSPAPSEVPDATKTPGAVNPAVTQANINQTICVPGWTKTIRPPVGYTNKLKLRQITQNGLPGSLKDYEEVHLIPLELGGATREEANPWPEPWDGEYGARKKDRLENKLHKLVCNGSMSLKDAQEAIVEDWVASYYRLITVNVGQSSREKIK